MMSSMKTRIRVAAVLAGLSFAPLAFAQEPEHVQDGQGGQGGHDGHDEHDEHDGHSHGPGHDHAHDHPASAHDAPMRTTPWDEETLALFAELPVQDGGRVKPMDSYAGLRLLTLNGKRTLELEDGTKLSALEWLLDTLFFPGQARTYPCFRVQHDAVLTAIGLEATGKRDWYSYDYLQPGIHLLMQHAQEYAHIEAADQTVVQSQILKLARDVRQFEELITSFGPIRRTYSTHASENLRGLFGGEPEGHLSGVLRRAGELRDYAQTLDGHAADQDPALSAFFGELGAALELSFRGIVLFPPTESAADEETWWSLADVVSSAFEAHLHSEAHIDLVASLERMAKAPDDAAAFGEELRSFHGGVQELAEARGELGRIPLEVRLNRLDPFTNSLVFYLLGFVLAAVGWLAPRKRWLGYGVWGSTGVAVVLAIVGITMRCIIRSRPPVVSLYDTILFVTTCVVLVSLLMERMTRQRVMLSLATILGAAGMFLAGRYELKEVVSSGDTMASVVAVLDTNYYLAIHVTTITMGYAGGLLAAAIAHVWILGRLFGLRRGDTAFYKTITRMTYGVVCFSLLFSIFGTIMGGVWANDSWGRFWGWDPKENGALLICLWHLITLHARMGGYIRDRGLAVFAIIGGVVVSLSWWGVNLLNVGLHSYGFTSGVAMTLFIAWGIESLVLLMAGVEALVTRNLTKGTSG